MNKNGGSRNIALKKSDSKLQIIGDTPEMTEDIKNTIDYLENVIINKNTLATMNTGELVQNINRLIQYVDVLSAYKKPTFKLLQMYNELNQLTLNSNLPQTTYVKNVNKKQIISEILGQLQTDFEKIQRKEYWEPYE